MSVEHQPDATTAAAGDIHSNAVGTDIDIVVFWRPGCPYCIALFDALDRANIAHTSINIWEDPAGAATVREAADGNETVPTVTIGTVALVNPDIRSIITVAAAIAPHTLAGRDAA